VLAERFGITEQTVYKWRKRDSVEDRSHTPHRLQTTLTPAQEAVAVALRKTLLVSLDDLLAVVREFLNPNVSRSGLDRCLRRHGVGNLRHLKAKAAKPKHSAFEAYEPGYVDIEVKYLPQMADENRRRYLFVAIDRATRWGEGRFGIGPVDQFSPEPAKPRLHPRLYGEDRGQRPAVPARSGTRLPDPHPHHSHGVADGCATAPSDHWRRQGVH
jgi:transposase-like protein